MQLQCIKDFTRAMEKARGLYSLKRGRVLPVGFIDSTFTLYDEHRTIL